jgi:hypothetical protein
MVLLRSILISVRGIQFLAAVSMLVVTGISAVGLDLMARNKQLAAWVDRKEKGFAEKSRLTFTHDGYFIDDNDRLLYEEMPTADYSKGGVYLMGSSTIRASTMCWELPADQSCLIHNYGINASDYTCQFLFLRHLIEHADLLRAGGDKTLVIFGGSYHNLSRRYDPNGFFANLWQRHGVYRYSRETGIIPVAVNPIWRFQHFERNRIAGCLNQLEQIVSVEVRRKVRRNDELQKKLDLKAANQMWSERMGPDWKEKIDEGVEEFSRTVDYLHARDVHVCVVLLPVWTSEDNLPYERTYIAEMKAVCAAKQIPLRDWSRMLPDEDLLDPSHPNVFGAEKLQPAFLDIALPFLRSTRALP